MVYGMREEVWDAEQNRRLSSWGYSMSHLPLVDLERDFLRDELFVLDSASLLFDTEPTVILPALPFLERFEDRYGGHWSGDFGNINFFYYSDLELQKFTFIISNNRTGYKKPVPSLSCNELRVFEDSCIDVIREGERRGILAGYFEGDNPVFEIDDDYYLEVGFGSGYTGVPIPSDPISGKYFFERAWIWNSDVVESGVRGMLLEKPRDLWWDRYPSVDPTETWIGPETYKRSW